MPAMLRIIPLAILLLGSSGCANSSRKWIGKWEGTHTALVSAELAEQNPALAASIRQVVLTINPDSTYTLVRAGMPESGNIVFAGDKATLTATMVLNQPLQRQDESVQRQYPPIPLTFSSSNTITFSDPADFGRNPITLTKTPSK